MKRLHLNILVLLTVFFSTFTVQADIYYVFYATIDGKSGHAGIAVDNYKVRVKDVYDSKKNIISVYDTIPDGTLTYFDVWPATDDFNAINVDVNTPAKYYKLPAATWENPITIASLLKKGIPHEEHYPVDGLIRIQSTPKEDKHLKENIEALIEKDKPFNVRTFNCADFVELILEQHLKLNIEADESIVFRKSTTPNKLYKAVLKLKNIEILKDAGNKANASFTKERLIKRMNIN